MRTIEEKNNAYAQAKETLSEEVLQFLKVAKKTKSTSTPILTNFKTVESAVKFLEKKQTEFSYKLSTEYSNFSVCGNGIVFSVHPVLTTGWEVIKNN